MNGMMTSPDEVMREMLANGMLSPVNLASYQVQPGMSGPPPAPTGMPPMPNPIINAPEMLAPVPAIEPMMQLPQTNAMMQAPEPSFMDRINAMAQQQVTNAGGGLGLLQQGIAGLEDNYLREILPADLYIKKKQQEDDAEIARQGQVLRSLQLESDLDYRRQQLDLERERNQIARETALRGPQGTAYLADAERLMSEVPGLSFADAYAIARTGLDKGLTTDAMGNIVPLSGAPDAAGQMSYGETAGGERAKVDVAVEAAIEKKTIDSTDAMALLTKANELLPKATAGGLQEGVKGTAAFFGQATEGSGVDAQLNIISAKLIGNVPRFEGPQGVLDVQLYTKAAGDLANTKLPVSDRMAAAQLMMELTSKYATGAPVTPAAPDTEDPRMKRLLELRAKRDAGTLK